MPETAHTDAALGLLRLYERNGDEFYLKKAKNAIERELSDD